MAAGKNLECKTADRRQSHRFESSVFAPHGSPDWVLFFSFDSDGLKLNRNTYIQNKIIKKIIIRKKRFRKCGFNGSKVHRSVLDKPQWRPHPPCQASKNNKIKDFSACSWFVFSSKECCLPLLGFGYLQFSVPQTETVACSPQLPKRNRK